MSELNFNLCIFLFVQAHNSMTCSLSSQSAMLLDFFLFILGRGGIRTWGVLRQATCHSSSRWMGRYDIVCNHVMSNQWSSEMCKSQNIQSGGGAAVWLCCHLVVKGCSSLLVELAAGRKMNSFLDCIHFLFIYLLRRLCVCVGGGGWLGYDLGFFWGHDQDKLNVDGWCNWGKKKCSQL